MGEYAAMVARAESLGPVRAESVIVIAELRNFTRMSEMLDAERVLALADRFFDLGARCAREHDGQSVEVHNDSLIATFQGAQAESLARRAVRAAQQLLADFDALSQEWQRDLGLRTAISIGVHRGEVIYGVAGTAAERRPLVFGDGISVAERLAHRARAGELVLSDAVMRVLTLTDLDMDAEPLPPLQLQQRPPMRIYGVLRDVRLDFTT